MLPVKGSFTLSVSVNAARTLNSASDTVLIESNGMTQKWVATAFWSNSIAFNENIITSVITELSQR